MRICFFGDSFTLGIGDETALGWVYRVLADVRAHDFETTIYNLGIRGDTSALIKDRWAIEWDARRKPGETEALVFSFGVNDACLDERTGTSRMLPDESITAAKAVLGQASAQAPVIMVGPVPIANDAVNADVARLDRDFSALCADLGVSYVSVFERLLDDDVWMTAVAAIDGAHPSSAGYQQLAQVISASNIWKSWLVGVLDSDAAPAR